MSHGQAVTVSLLRSLDVSGWRSVSELTAHSERRCCQPQAQSVKAHLNSAGRHVDIVKLSDNAVMKVSG
jgi:hypothetical protein